MTVSKKKARSGQNLPIDKGTSRDLVKVFTKTSCANPKFEYRNPKQIQMTRLEHSSFVFQICFVFRYLHFQFQAGAKPQIHSTYFCANPHLRE